MRPQHAGQRQILHDDRKGLRVLALTHHLYIPLHVDARRTGQAAGGLVGLLDRKGTRNGLGVTFIGCLAVAQSLIVFVGQGYGACFGAISARGAFGRVDEAGGFVDGNCEIAFRPLDLFYFRAGDQIDV